MNNCWWCGIEIPEGDVCELCESEGFTPPNEWMNEDHKEKIQEEGNE